MGGWGGVGWGRVGGGAGASGRSDVRDGVAPTRPEGASDRVGRVTEWGVTEWGEGPSDRHSPAQVMFGTASRASVMTVFYGAAVFCVLGIHSWKGCDPAPCPALRQLGTQPPRARGCVRRPACGGNPHAGPGAHADRVHGAHRGVGRQDAAPHTHGMSIGRGGRPSPRSLAPTPLGVTGVGGTPWLTVANRRGSCDAEAGRGTSRVASGPCSEPRGGARQAGEGGSRAGGLFQWGGSLMRRTRARCDDLAGAGGARRGSRRCGRRGGTCCRRRGRCWGSATRRSCPRSPRASSVPAPPRPAAARRDRGVVAWPRLTRSLARGLGMQRRTRM